MTTGGKIVKLIRNKVQLEPALQILSRKSQRAAGSGNVTSSEKTTMEGGQNKLGLVTTLGEGTVRSCTLWLNA